MTDIKYIPEDIDRIFEERVDYMWNDASLKKRHRCGVDF